MSNIIRYVVKPTTACNFSCTFCSAKLLDIPVHNKVPISLKNYIIENKVNHLSISGGEPLMNPTSYFEDLICIMEEVNKTANNPYELSLTSNLVLWYENPEKWDFLFKNPHVIVETSFQYGGERKDSDDFSEQRFISIFNKFKERYGYELGFIYVVNENNEKYILKACELAKKLNTKLFIGAQLPLGISNYYYPRHKLLNLLMTIIDNNYENQVYNFHRLYTKCCPFVPDPEVCYKFTKELYVDKEGNLHEEVCDLMICTNEHIPKNESVIFSKCYGCKLLRLCNGCIIERHYLKNIKDEYCTWMKSNYKKLQQYGFIDDEF